MRCIAGLLFGAWGLAGVLHAAATPKVALLVLSKADHTLAIVDPVSLKVIARMPSGPDPHEVVATADGRFAYISNYGGGAYHTLTPVDLVKQATLPVIDLGCVARAARPDDRRRKGVVYGGSGKGHRQL